MRIIHKNGCTYIVFDDPFDALCLFDVLSKHVDTTKCNFILCSYGAPDNAIELCDI